MDLVPLSYFLCLSLKRKQKATNKNRVVLIENCNHAWVDKKIETGHVFVRWTQ